MNKMAIFVEGYTEVVFVDQLIEEGFQELARAFVGDIAAVIHQLGLERNIGLAAHHQHTDVAEHGPQMLLRDRGAASARLLVSQRANATRSTGCSRGQVAPLRDASPRGRGADSLVPATIETSGLACRRPGRCTPTSSPHGGRCPAR